MVMLCTIQLNILLTIDKSGLDNGAAFLLMSTKSCYFLFFTSNHFVSCCILLLKNV